MKSLPIDSNYSPSQQGQKASCLGEENRLLKFKVSVYVYCQCLCVHMPCEVPVETRELERLELEWLGATQHEFWEPDPCLLDEQQVL